MSRQGNRRLFLLLPLAIAAALALVAATVLPHDAPRVAAVGENSLTSPDGADVTGEFASLKLDDDGFPVVAYLANLPAFPFSRQVRLLRCDDVNCAGSGESVEVVTSSGFGILSPSLTLDGVGNPVISYSMGNTFGVTVVHCNDSNCAGGDESSVTYLAGAIISESRHVLDSNGLPVVFFRGDGMQMLRCANPNCTTLSNDPNFLIQPGNSYTYSFALDAAGFPVIGYIGNNTGIGGDLMLLHCNDLNCAGGDESNLVVDGTTIGGLKIWFHTALALVGGNPVIAYSHADLSPLKVARCDDPNCAAGGDSIEFATTGLGNGSPGIAIDANGFPIVSFYRSLGGTRVLHCNDAACAGGDESEQLVSSQNGNPSIQGATSILLDGNGFPVVAFFAASPQDLFVLHCGNANCSPLDTDGDGVPDATDNCVVTANPGQLNTDAANTAANRPGADGLGDACDDDIDGDGYTNAQETAPPLAEDPLTYCDIMRADVDGDRAVTILDLTVVAGQFLTNVPPAPERIKQDADNAITILDLATMANLFLNNVSACP